MKLSLSCKELQVKPTSIACVLSACGSCLAAPIDVEFAAPDHDRWFYPFNMSPGAELASPVFGALGLEGFDDRDSQFVLGFETGDAVEAGLGVGAYRVTRAQITVTIAGGEFVYDPSFDTLETYLPPDHPAHSPDADAGRPVDLFGVGYRNGESLEAFTEFSEFGGPPLVPPAEGARNVFAANLDDEGGAADASRNVRLGFEARPIATGASEGLTPGEAVPADAEFTFDIDLCMPGVPAYLAGALDAGKLVLAVTSLHDAAQGGPTTYPVFYTKENPFNRPSRLALTVVVNEDADLNGDGVKDLFDFLAYQNLFAAQDPIADFAPDCQFDLFDFLAYLNAFNK